MGACGMPARSSQEVATIPQDGGFAGTRPESESPAPTHALEVSEDELALRFTQRLRLFASRHLHDATVAEDVAQEALRRVVEALRANRITHRDALPAFVFQTARNICLHWVRSTGRERSAFARFERDAAYPAECTDALAGLIAAERVAVVRAALDELRDRDRRLLSMIYYDGLDNGRVAAQLGITVTAVRVRKHRALQRLAALLGETDGNETSASGTLE